jgi:hypothetical protein
VHLFGNTPICALCNVQAPFWSAVFAESTVMYVAAPLKVGCVMDTEYAENTTYTKRMATLFS